MPDNTTMEMTWPVGSPPAVKPLNRFDVIRWDYFTEEKIYLKSDFSNVENLQGAHLLDIQVGKKFIFCTIKKKLKMNLKFSSFFI